MMADSGTAALTRGLESLLPWHATGRLSPSEARRIDAGLAGDAALAQAYVGIRRERADIIELNEELGAPSPRARLALFAAIDIDILARPKSS